MNFLEAIDALQKGLFVVREGWKVEHGYLAFMPAMQGIWKILFHPTVNAGNHFFNMEEMMANDWKVVSREDIVNQIPKPQANDENKPSA